MDEVYDKYFDKIYYWSIKKTNNKEDAEDLTNDIFTAIFEYFNNNIRIEKIENLIWKISINIWNKKAQKYIKEKQNVNYESKYDISVYNEPLDRLIYREIIENLDKLNLSEKEYLSFKFYYKDDLSIKEISNKINSTESNIKYYLYSARKKVKERYE